MKQKTKQRQLPSSITGAVIKEVAKNFEVKTSWAAEALNKIYSKTKDESEAWLKESFKKEFPNAGKQEKLCMKELIRISYAVPGLKTVTDLKDIKKSLTLPENPDEESIPKSDKKAKKEKHERATPKSTELREVYNYPENCENKKAYRVKMRKQKADLLAAIENAKSESDKAKAEKAYKEFRKKTYIE